MKKKKGGFQSGVVDQATTYFLPLRLLVGLNIKKSQKLLIWSCLSMLRENRRRIPLILVLSLHLFFMKWYICFVQYYAIIAFIWGEHRKLSTRGWLYSTRASARGKTTSQGLTSWYSTDLRTFAHLFLKLFHYQRMPWRNLIKLAIVLKISNSSWTLYRYTFKLSLVNSTQQTIVSHDIGK
jgi:hypothetical protein